MECWIFISINSSILMEYRYNIEMTHCHGQVRLIANNFVTNSWHDIPALSPHLKLLIRQMTTYLKGSRSTKGEANLKGMALLFQKVYNCQVRFVQTTFDQTQSKKQYKFLFWRFLEFNHKRVSFNHKRGTSDLILIDHASLDHW